MIRLASLGSGSRGNATLIQAQDGCVLVDCGFSVKDLRRRARVRGFELDRIEMILVTHEHGDHCSGVAALSRLLRIPVYLTHGTLASGRLDGCFEVRCFNAGERFQLLGMSVQAVAVPHDAREPVQYVFDADGCRIGVLTDLGSLTPHVTRAFAGCHVLLLEFNHDREMLAAGPYPPTLQRRVGGDWGHLSNCQSIALLRQWDLRRLQHLVVAHISEKNNSQARVRAILEAHMPSLLSKTVWATQTDGFDWIAVVRETHKLDAAEPEPDRGDALASATAEGAY